MMKKLLVLSITMALACIGSAYSPITGFGRLKLGMTIDQLEELNNAEPISASVLLEHSEFQNENKIYEIILDTMTNAYPYYGALDPSVRSFYLDRLAVTPEISLDHVSLKFCQGKLYSIKISDYKIKEILTVKYGEPTKSTEGDEKVFSDSEGNRVVRMDSKITSTWDTKNYGFGCYEVQRIWYSDLDGKMNFMTATYLLDKNVQIEVSAIEERIRGRMKERELIKNREKLNGF